MGAEANLQATAAGPRLLIVGDSQIFGLGVRGASFGQLAAAEVRATAVLDISDVSKTAAEALADAAEIRAFAPAVAILCCGATESLVHPGPVVRRAIERWAPPSWHGANGLDPRPYYSRRLSRRLRQRLTSVLKVAVKQVVIRATGGRRRIPVEEFRASFEALLSLLGEIDCRAVVVGMWKFDERMFPRTPAALAATQSVLEECVEACPHAVMVHVWEELDYWGDFQEDRAHFGEAGHRRIARMVAREIESAESEEGTPSGIDRDATRLRSAPLRPYLGGRNDGA